jgi:hypothetical protein
MRKIAGSLMVAITLAGCAGCGVGVRVYDEPHRDYHRWDDREERAYRAYLTERRREYREFRGLDRREQEEYWSWRHDHPDRDRK